MKIARIKQDTRMFQNQFPVPILLKGGNKYVMSDFVMGQLKQITPEWNVKEEKGFWSFENQFHRYKGEDLSGKTLLAWRTGGIGDFCWVSASVHAFKAKFPDMHFIMACAPQYNAVVNSCPDFDETFVLPINAKLLKRSHYHAIFENAIENNPRAEILNCYDLFAERFYLDWREMPNEYKKPWLIPQDHAVEKLHKMWKALDIDHSEMKIGVQVKTSSPVRTPDFSYMLLLIKMLKEKWPNSYIFIFDSPANVERVDEGIRRLKPLSRIVNWLRVFQDLSITIALTAELDLVVAPDSSLNHFAAAFDVPNVGIFTAFRPEMRLLYYPYADWVTADYDKWNACAPCWVHTDEACPYSKMMGCNDHAVCLDSIKMNDIMDKISIVIERKKKGIPRWGDGDPKDEMSEKKYIPGGNEVDVDADPYSTGKRLQEKVMQKKVNK